MKIPEVRPNTGFPFHLVLTWKCVDDSRFIAIWCHFSRYASLNPPLIIIRSYFIYLFPHSVLTSTLPTLIRLTSRTVHPFYVRIAAALPLTTFIRVALRPDGSGHHHIHNESSNIGLLALVPYKFVQQGSCNFFISPSPCTLLVSRYPTFQYPLVLVGQTCVLVTLVIASERAD